MKNFAIRLTLILTLVLTAAVGSLRAQTIQDSQITQQNAMFWTSSTDSDPAGRLTFFSSDVLAAPGTQIARADYGAFGFGWNLIPTNNYVYEFQASTNSIVRAFGIRTVCAELHGAEPCFIGAWTAANDGSGRLQPAETFRTPNPPKFDVNEDDKFGIEWNVDGSGVYTFKYFKNRTLVYSEALTLGPVIPSDAPKNLAVEFNASSVYRNVKNTTQFSYSN